MNSEDPLRQTLRSCRAAFAWLALFSGCINVLMLTAPLYMLQVFDRVLASRSTETLLALSLMAGLALLTLGALEGVRSFILIRISNWIDHRLGATVLHRGVAAAVGSGDPPSVQGLRDLSTFRTFITGASMFPLLDAPWTPLFIVVVFMLNPLLGWLALGGAVVLLILAIANEMSTRTLLASGSEAQIAALRDAEAAVRNADAIQAMGMMGAILQRWELHAGEALHTQARASARSGSLSAVTRFTRLGLQTGMLGTGAWLVIDNQLTPGGMVASTILLGRALAPVDQSISAWKGLVAARAAYARLRAQLAGHHEPPPSPSLPRPNGEIQVDAVAYTHPGGTRPTIKQLSFELAAGKTLGIVGPTAAGKSTLARLLVGNLTPQAGHVRVDGIEIAHWDAADRGRHIGFVPQDVELFAGTVGENIARMGDGDDEAVVEAAKLAGAHELIARLPEAYGTTVGQDGSHLSGGQRQRIALARAVYGDPALVVLDEPNANLDQDGVNALVTTIDRLKAQGTTIVLIAHQPAIVAQMDYLLVLHEGVIQVAGPRAEVLTKLKSAAGGPQMTETADEP